MWGEVCQKEARPIKGMWPVKGAWLVKEIVWRANHPEEKDEICSLLLGSSISPLLSDVTAKGHPLTGHFISYC